MAGHSKWANTKHRKARADAERSLLFSRLAKEVATAVKVGGSDPETNQRLRLVLQKAKKRNMPTETIDRIIKKMGKGALYEPVHYEIYGVGGVGIYCEASTDNKNRLACQMRLVSHRTEATLATPGSVAFQFRSRGVLLLPLQEIEESALFLLVSEAGALDFEVQKEGYRIVTEPQHLHLLSDTLLEQGILFDQAEIERIPTNWITLSQEEQAKNRMILEALESIEDLDHLYHNMAMERA